MARIDYCFGEDEPVIVVIRSQKIESIFDAYAAAEGFPDYFSRNLDSLESCIRDLLVVEGRGLVVLHGCHFTSAAREVRIYLEIMQGFADTLGMMQLFVGTDN